MKSFLWLYRVLETSFGKQQPVEIVFGQVDDIENLDHSFEDGLGLSNGSKGHL
ncbi:MAG: hypothetical protein KME57_23835 [Scytonema hyalinum WJT4-NPBG1]|jgi:hypothetical protein|nr:hypothetical protein [Scytonema hyalinum WJT4-NPBG1]